MHNEFSTKFETVMVIDDNEIDLYIADRLITKTIFARKVIKFTSGIDALAYLSLNNHNRVALPDIIFVDINMPVMSGFEFADAYGALPHSAKARQGMFMVSSSIDKSEVNRAIENEHIRAFHQKPVNKAFLESICN